MNMKTNDFCEAENHSINCLFESKPTFNKFIKEIKIRLSLSLRQINMTKCKKLSSIGDPVEEVIMNNFICAYEKSK